MKIVVIDIMNSKEYTAPHFARARKNLFFDNLISVEPEYKLAVDFQGEPILIKQKQKKEAKKRGRPAGSKNKPKQDITQINIDFRYKVEDGIRRFKGSFIMKKAKPTNKQVQKAIDKYVDDFETNRQLNTSPDVEVIRNSIGFLRMDIPYTKDLKKVTMYGETVKYAGDRRFEGWTQKNIDENCVIDYLTNIYSKSEKKYIQKWNKSYILENLKVTEDEVKKNGFSDEMLRKWCEHTRQPFYSFDLNNTLIDSFYPEKPDHHLTSVLFVKVNSHFYPIVQKEIRQSLLNQLNGNGFKSRRENRAQEEKKVRERMVLTEKDTLEMIESEKIFEKFSGKDVYVFDTNDLNGVTSRIIQKFKKCGILKGTKLNMNNLYFPEEDVRIYANTEYHMCAAVAESFGYEYHNEALAILVKRYSEEQLPDFHHSELTASMSRQIKTEPWKLLAVNYRREFLNESIIKNCTIGDINKAFPHALMNSPFAFPVYSKYDNIEDFAGELKAGFFYVKSYNKFPLQGNGWYFASLVQYALDKKIISTEDIQYQYIPSKTLPKDFFVKFIHNIWNLNIAEKYKKQILVRFIGMMYKDAVVKNEQVIYVENFNEACYYYFKYAGTCIEQNDKGFLVHYTKLQPLDKVDSPIYLSMMANYRVHLHQVYEKMMDNEDAYLVAIKTDCIAVCNGNEVRDSATFGGVKNDKFPMMKKPVNFRGCCAKYSKPSWNIEHFDNKKDADLVEEINPGKFNRSYMINCGGGFGKSFYLEQLMRTLRNEKIGFMALAYTHTAKNRLKLDDKVVGITLRKFFINDFYKERCLINDVKVVIVDEVSMVPGYFWKKIDELKKIGITVIGAGDFNQLPPVEGETLNSYYDSDMLKGIFDSHEVRFTQYHRGDKHLKSILDRFLEFDKINIKQFGNAKCDVNLVYTNAKRKDINKDMMSKHKAHIVLPKLDGDDYSQEMRVYTGLPIISRMNWKGSFEVKGSTDKCKIFNNEWFKVVGFEGENILISNDEGEVIVTKKDIFVKLFVPRYAMTIHKVQGMTLYEPYTIHELNNLDKQLLYVAVSRATEVSQINFSL